MFEYKGNKIEINDKGKFVCQVLNITAASLDAIKKKIDALEQTKPFEPIEVQSGCGVEVRKFTITGIRKNNRARAFPEYYFDGFSAFPYSRGGVSFYIPNPEHAALHVEYDTIQGQIDELEARQKEIKETVNTNNFWDYCVEKGIIEG